MKKLFIGKLSLSTTENELRTMFAPYEPLNSVKVITDKFSGKSRGFAFVEIEDNDKASEAIKALDGAELDGDEIVVNEARPQTEGSRTSGSYRPRYGDAPRSSGSSYRSNSNRY